MLSHFLLNNSINFSVQDVTNFQKVLGKLEKMGDANLNKQQQRTLDSYLKSSQGYLFHFLVKYFVVQFIFIVFII
jgi:hypothetical protein